MADQPAPTYLTAEQARQAAFPVNRGRYEIEPVDGFRLEAAAALEHLEHELDAARRRAEQADANLEQVREAGAGDPFTGAARLVEQQERAQVEIDKAVSNAQRWAADHVARARQHSAEVVDRAEQTAQRLLEDARRAAADVAGAPMVPEPPATGDQLTDAINLAKYVHAARRAHDDHAVGVHERLDARLAEAEQALDAAEARTVEARAALKAARRTP